MIATHAVDREAAGGSEPVPPRRAPRLTIFDLGALGIYFLAALYVVAPVAIDPDNRWLFNRDDQIFFEYVLTHAPHAITHGDNPMLATAMNTPYGVNLMANTSVLGVAIPLSPITLFLGASIAYVSFTILALFLTAAAWYIVLSRYVVSNRVAAFVGAAFCGFGPGPIAQANGHPNIVLQAVVPFILWRVISLPQARGVVRAGVILGLLIVLQFFINEEVLFITAQVAATCAVVALWVRRSAVVAHWVAYAKGLAVAGVVAAVLLAYPLYYQFFGPQAYHGIPSSVAQNFGLDLVSWISFPPRTMWGENAASAKVALSGAESNSFFGWPLVIVLLAIVVWQWRNLLVRMAAVVALWFALLSLGARWEYQNAPTGIRSPWTFIVKLPLFNSIVPARFGLTVTIAAGVLLAIGVDALLRLGALLPVGLTESAKVARLQRRVIQIAGLLAVGLALLPLLPAQVPVYDAARTPHFITSGQWRTYLTDGRSLMVGDLSRNGDVTAMRWSTQENLHLPIARGYFLAPNPNSPHHTAVFGGPHTPTVVKMMNAYASGRIPKITPADQAIARRDFDQWHVGIIVLPVDYSKGYILKSTLTGLLGQGPTRADDVWLWQIG